MASSPAVDAKSRLQQWLQIHPNWVAVWLEGIDPPRRLASTPNVTLLMLSNTQAKRGNKDEEFGFIMTSSRIAAKRKEREKECAKELVDALDQVPLEDMKAWSQMPDASNSKKEVDAADLERLTALVQKRVPKATVELPDPTAFVLVAAMPWGPNERAHGPDPELPLLDKFDPGFAELLKESRRVSGLVRKQWWVAIAWAKLESPEEKRPFSLGIGLAADRGLARVRAVHAAEVRAAILTESMFGKATPQKSEKEEKEKDKDKEKEKDKAKDKDKDKDKEKK